MDISRRLFELRKNYTLGGLDKSMVLPHPVDQFNKWFDQATLAEVPEPNAMTLSTVSSLGRVSARVVLLKEFNRRGFVFYTNYNSRKGKDIQVNPMASLTFLWLELERQIRIEGIIEKTTEQESDEYFASRPRESQLGAWASNQSSVINSREVLSQAFLDFDDKYRGQTVPRPEWWGGYRLIPDVMELWQGGPRRIHDRVVYTRAGDEWEINILAP
jgi:pyridoxamine 5'-phosphate oxidase